MAVTRDLKVHLAFDPEAVVWYVSASEVPGLRLEADDPVELVRRVRESAAELLALNGTTGRIGLTPIFDSALPVAA